MSAGTEEAVHACAVLVSAEQQAEVAAGFVARHLAAGRRVVVLGLDAEAAALTRRLREDGEDSTAARARGQLVLFAEEEATAVLALPRERFGGWLADLVGAAARSGSAGLAAVTGALVPRGDAQEASLDGAVRVHGVPVLCLYARLLMDDDAVVRVRALHEAHLDAVALHDDGMLRITADAPGVLRLAGELDLSNRAEATTALRAALPGSGDLELDLASLRFLDAGGAWALLDVARRSAADGLLRVRRVRPAVLRVLELVDLGGSLRVTEERTR